MSAAPPSMALGTAQWGLDYGVANRSGRPDDAALSAMLAMAAEAGVTLIDTARAYGDAEARIGALADVGRFRIVTKPAPDVWTDGMAAEEAVARTLASVEASISALRTDRLDTLLLHRAEHRTACGGAVWDALLTLREAGRIARLGISAASPDAAMAALDDPDVAVVQAAASLLDRRLERLGFFAAARAAGTEIHLRSLYLQGAAFLAPDALPAHLAPLRAPLEAIGAWEAARDLPPGGAFLAHARTLPAAALVLGAETPDQLAANLAAFGAPPPAGVTELADSLPELSDSVLDPWRWPG